VPRIEDSRPLQQGRRILNISIQRHRGPFEETLKQKPLKKGASRFQDYSIVPEALKKRALDCMKCKWQPRPATRFLVKKKKFLFGSERVLNQPHFCELKMRSAKPAFFKTASRFSGLHWPSIRKRNSMALGGDSMLAASYICLNVARGLSLTSCQCFFSGRWRFCSSRTSFPFT
jgi:hypothetical protein